MSEIYGQCAKCSENLTADHKCFDFDLSPWKSIESAPKDGTHILACLGPYSPTWGFNQCPPAVVHWWNEPGEEGFYLSCGDQGYPYKATHWMPLGEPPK